MFANPKIGDKVRLNYKNKTHPLQGAEGIITVVSKGKPRNHTVRLGEIQKDENYWWYYEVVVPCGNIVKVKE